jgi:hypothetical protein
VCSLLARVSKRHPSSETVGPSKLPTSSGYRGVASDLMQLDPISLNERQALRELRLHPDAVLHRSSTGQGCNGPGATRYGAGSALPEFPPSTPPISRSVQQLPAESGPLAGQGFARKVENPQAIAGGGFLIRGGMQVHLR